MILLDTSVLSRVFRRRHPGPAERRLREVVDGLLAGDAPLGLPSIVFQEVLSGVRSDTQFAALEAKLLSAFATLHPTTRDYVDAARLKNSCLTKGLNVSGIDCLIATVAISGEHVLFATDSDFPAIARHAPLRLYT